MKNITVGLFSLATMMGMAATSANAVRAAGTALEGAKQESGVEFGEMGGLKARGGSSAVSASGDGVSRAALTVGTLDIKAIKTVRRRPEVPSPGRTHKSTGSGLLKFGKLALGLSAATLGAGVGFVVGTVVAVALGIVAVGTRGMPLLLWPATHDWKRDVLGMLAAPFIWTARGAQAGYKVVSGLKGP